MGTGHFRDRTEAGERLARALEAYRGTDALVLAIPRGGVTVGHAVAKALGLPLDIVLAKKLGHPENPEFAVGAVSLEAVHLDPRFGLPQDQVDLAVEQLRAQLRERALRYRGDRPPPRLRDRTLIVVDDGVATGHTLLATLDLLRRQHPAAIVVAMPVVPPSFLAQGRSHADAFIHLLAPSDFQAVGQVYADFRPVEDGEVVRLLNDAWQHTP